MIFLPACNAHKFTLFKAADNVRGPLIKRFQFRFTAHKAQKQHIHENNIRL